MDEISQFFSTTIGFMCISGYHPNLNDQLLLAEETMESSLYTRLEELPKLSDRQMSEHYKNIYEIRKQEGFSPEIKDVLGKFQSNHPSPSESICTNFIIKLLFWQDTLCEEEMPQRITFLCTHKLTLQEFLGLYFLTTQQVSVLLLSTAHPISWGSQLLDLTSLKSYDTFAELTLPPYQKKNLPQAPPSRPKIQISQIPRPKIPLDPVVQAKKITSQPTSQERSFEELAKLATSVVMIAVLDENQVEVRYGSGIMIHEKGYILTNFHVVVGGFQYGVRIENEDTIYYTDTLVKYHDVLDLAIIRIDRDCVPIGLTTRDLVRGQTVVAIGSPLGMFNSVSDGIIAGFRTIHHVDMIQFTAPTSRGSSGGAVLNKYGELIGISTAGIDDGQNLNLAVDYKTIRTFAQGFLGNL